MMNILLLSPKQNESNSLSEALTKYGHVVTVAGADFAGRNMIRGFGKAVKLALGKARRADLIILDGASYDRSVALLEHRFRNVPLVLHLKGYFPTEFSESPLGKSKEIINSLVVNRLLMNCAHIVYISQWLREKYMGTPTLAMMKDKPSSVIYLGADPFFHPSGTKSDFQDNVEMSLCYAGHFIFFDKARGVLLILDAYSRALQIFPKLRLYICGDGKHKAMLEEKARELNLGETVVFTGRVSREELREYYRRSYAFVYSSFLDGSSKTVLEAQACGTPAIVTYGSGAAELVKDGVSGIVCQPTVESLADSILYLLRNRQVRQTMALQAIEHMQRNLSWEIAGAKFSEVIASFGRQSSQPV